MLRMDRCISRGTGTAQHRSYAPYLLIVGFTIVYFWIISGAPEGEFDAIWWDMKALFIAEGRTLDAFTNPVLPHPEYPPLLPLAIGGVWRVFGIDQAPRIILHGAFYVGLLMAFSRMRWWAFAIAGIATLRFAIMQYADLPVALCCLWAWLTYRRYGDHVLVGSMLGVGLLIKNESLMLSVIMFAVVAMDTRRIPLRALIGALPGAIALLLFKLLIATQPNDLMGSAGVVDRLLHVERYRLILSYAGPHLMQWSTVAIPLLVMCAVIDRSRIDRTALLWVAVSALGYMLIYGLTPHDLTWHLETSFSRLVLHVFPVFALSIGRSATN